MEIKPVLQATEWEPFARKYVPSSLLQGWPWGEFSLLQHHQPFFLGIYDKNQLVGGALLTKIVARRGTYLVCHGGPLIDWSSDEMFRQLHPAMTALARREGASFLRIRPPILHTEEEVKRFSTFGYRPAPMGFPAEHTLLLNLEPSEDELFRGLRKNTRYYVRKAQNEGVVVTISQATSDLDALYELYRETVSRQRFIPYSRRYFDDEVRAFAETNEVDIVLAYQDDVLRAGAMIIYYGETAYYHHGASRRTDKESFAAYLLQWEAIRHAKARGITTYDFWGVAPTDDPKHPKAGLTIFKRGFGGERVRWLQSLDYPLSWKYWPTYAYAKYEKWLRGWV